MNPVWPAILTAAGIVLAADLLATQLRKRARRMTVLSELSLKEEEPHGSTDGKITVQTE